MWQLPWLQHAWASCRQNHRIDLDWLAYELFPCGNVEDMHGELLPALGVLSIRQQLLVGRWIHCSRHVELMLLSLLVLVQKDLFRASPLQAVAFCSNREPQGAPSSFAAWHLSVQFLKGQKHAVECFVALHRHVHVCMCTGFVLYVLHAIVTFSMLAHQ